MIIAIDPDVSRSGVAILNKEQRSIEIKSLAFPQLVDFLQGLIVEPSAIVYVEAGWLNKGNWHLKSGQGVAVAAATGSKTGANHQVGKQIVEMARHYGLDVKEVKPLRKGWSGPSGKITHEEITYFIPGLPKRTNQEERDAALIAWEYANLPIKINVANGKIKTSVFKKR